ncbi:hypothetical protein MNB_SV-13-2031 [hydrothermal vent metagenome]|uniref:Uncharacterized protein n=1 Tax=hydrothermal vent metagenome TaxID=652676 RepID=A0A1W1BXT8_9ZZZZ
MFGLPLREGFTMKIEGVYLTRPELHEIAEELGIAERDILIKDGILTVYNTSESSQEIIDDGALASFVAMTIDIPVENISEMTAVVEEPIEMEFDLSEFEDEDDD